MNVTAEEIRRNIKISTKKYTERIEANKEKRKIVKQGIKYIHDNKLDKNIFDFNFFKYDVTFCYQIVLQLQLDENTVVDGEFLMCTYCIKSPIDKHCYKTAKSLLGQRIKNIENNCTIWEPVHKDTHKKDYIKNMLIVKFLDRTISPHYKEYGIPKKMREAFLRDPLYFYKVKDE